VVERPQKRSSKLPDIFEICFPTTKSLSAQRFGNLIL